ncbi:hypothetical protein [Rhizobium sp. Leaf262]|uniref:hypothetical protein n=1 Tax=Rhizobium sp. Leaf262 TaxID=1736312 RepID=UPI00138F1C6C|nr:hypothetical protein [Rhizobium sp. Leaf262]
MDVVLFMMDRLLELRASLNRYGLEAKSNFSDETAKADFIGTNRPLGGLSGHEKNDPQTFEPHDTFRHIDLHPGRYRGGCLPDWFYAGRDPNSTVIPIE